MNRRTTSIPLLLLIAIAFGVAGLSLMNVGCSSELKTSNKTPVESVEGLLKLRSQNSTDTKAYLRHVESTGLAEAIAADSAEQTRAAIPSWRTPKVSEQTTSTAEVIVQWIENKRFSDRPAKTTFLLKKVRGRWVIFDAKDTAASKEETSAP